MDFNSTSDKGICMSLVLAHRKFNLLILGYQNAMWTRNLVIVLYVVHLQILINNTQDIANTEYWFNLIIGFWGEEWKTLEGGHY